MTGEQKYYAVGDKEYLTAISIDEAIEEYLDDHWTDKSPGDLPKTARVQGYAPRRISEDLFFDRLADDLIEYLDEEYGDPENSSDYKLSAEARQIFNAFKAQVIAEYPVWQCEQVGEAVDVDLTPYIDAVVSNI